MKRHRHLPHFLAYLFLSVLLFFPGETIGAEKGHKDIRASILAGTWYPGTRDALAKNIQGLLRGVEAPNLSGQLMAIIVPHAGYKYSGPVAAHAYQLLKKRQFKRVILVGPSHHVAFRGVSVNLQSGYETPLGIVPVDLETAKKILNSGPDIRWYKEAHAREHSLEIQLPFLQSVLHNFEIVPIVMGQQDLDTCLNLANVLAKALGNAEGTLLLASSDLSHYHTDTQARALDSQFIEDTRAFDPQGLARDLSLGKCEACGGGPVISVMLAADRAVVLNYGNSGDATGDYSRVVGYLAGALIRSSDRDQHLK